MLDYGHNVHIFLIILALRANVGGFSATVLAGFLFTGSNTSALRANAAVLHVCSVSLLTALLRHSVLTPLFPSHLPNKNSEPSAEKVTCVFIGECRAVAEITPSP